MLNLLFQSVTLMIYHVLLNLKGVTFTTAPWNEVQIRRFTFVIPNLERWVQLTEGTDYSPSVEAENGFSKTSVGAEQVKSQSS